MFLTVLDLTHMFLTVLDLKLMDTVPDQTHMYKAQDQTHMSVIIGLISIFMIIIEHTQKHASIHW
jgi:hypothetical protein